MKKQTGARLWTVLNGDLCEGDHHDTFQLMTRNEDWMVQAAVELLSGVREMSDVFFVVSGTPAHIGQQGGLDERVAQALDATPGGRGRLSFSRLRFETASGVLFDVKHRARMGNLPHTFPNALSSIVMQVCWQASQRQIRPPDVIIRSHVHRYATSGDNYRTRAFSTPCWKATDEYVDCLPYEPVVNIGLLAFWCYDGKFNHWWIGRDRYTPLPEKTWRLHDQ
jgi:hypothetical protein